MQFGEEKYSPEMDQEKGRKKRGEMGRRAPREERREEEEEEGKGTGRPREGNLIYRFSTIAEAE